MREIIYKMKNPMGFHARPASQVFMAAAAFRCRIEATANGEATDCKELLSLMSLGVKEGEEITFRFDGEDEEEAVKALLSVLEGI